MELLKSKQGLHVTHGSGDLGGETVGILKRVPRDQHEDIYRNYRMIYRFRRRFLRGDVEEDQVFASNNVGDTVSVVSHRTEATTGRNTVGVLVQIQLGSLTVGCLGSRQAPGLAQHLLQEGRIHFQVLGDDVEAKQVTINAFPAHGVLVAFLMNVTRIA